MKIITETLTLNDVKKMAAAKFGDMLKAVVDIERGLLAVDAELHSDLEALLLQDESKQKNLWGINFYPDLKGDDFLEFDSMINIRPAQANMSRGVDDPQIRQKIWEVVNKWVKR